MRWQPLWRALAAFAAVVLLLGALAGSFFILLSGAVSAQAPDPFIADGDPCCGHPDTWGEVATGVAWTLGLIGIDGLLIAGAVALLRWSTSTSWPRRTRLCAIPLAGVLGGVVIFSVVLIPQLDEGRDLPGCDSFVLRQADWRSPDVDRHLATAWGIAECQTFQNASGRAVQRRLGKGRRDTSLGNRNYYLSYDGLDLIFQAGRVVEADAGYQGG